MACKEKAVEARTLACACLMILLVGCAIVQAPAQTGPAKPQAWPAETKDIVAAGASALGSAFVKNEGQVADSAVVYYVQSGLAAFGAGQMTMFVKGDGGQGSAVRYEFIGANPVAPEGDEPLAWKSSYFYGCEPSGWRSGTTNYGSVVYRGLWDGIDMRCRLVEGGLKYEFLVAPRADHSQIRIRITGHSGLSVSEDELRIATGLGPGSDMVDAGLAVSYTDGGALDARFEPSGADSYGFYISGRDMSRGILIDPLISSTLLGGSGADAGTAVATDSEGNVYIAGDTDSADFPTTLGVFQTERIYTYDTFVAKFSADCSELLYSTYLGDEGEDRCTSLAVDSLGRAYVTGYTRSIDFPTTPGALDRTYGGDTFDGFVTCLDQDGASLVYSTFLGADRVEQCYGIAVDDMGYAYVTGYTYSLLFPTTAGSLTWSRGLSDIFISKLSPAGDYLAYSCAFGTTEYDEAYAIAIDKWGYAYVTGFTRSASYMAGSTAFDTTHNGGLDVFVTKVTPSGSAFAYSTFLGGSGGDVGQAISVDEWGYAYVTGYTMSEDFPTTENAADRTFNGWADAFVTVLGRFGEGLISSTFLGGAGGDYGNGIARDAEGCAYVTGVTVSGDFPVTESAINTTYSGGSDAFVSKIGFSEGLIHSTFLGGNASDKGAGIALAPSTGYLFVTGETSSPDFPATAGAFDTTLGGPSDAFLTMLDLTNPTARAGPDRQEPEGSTITLDGSASTDNHGVVNYTWSFSDGISNLTGFGPQVTHTFAVPGIYEASLEVRDSTGNVGTDTAILNITDITLPVPDAGADILTDEDLAVIFNGTACTDNVGIANFTWRFTERGIPVELYGPTCTHTFATPGIYDVELVIADAAGNRAEDVVRVTVLDVTAPVADAGRDRAIYRGSAFTFNGTGSSDNAGIASYVWSFIYGGAVVLLSGPTPTRTFEVEGVYDVSLQVADAAGNLATDTMRLTVLETVKPSAEAGPDITVDEQKPMSFDGSGCTDNVGVARWAWTFTEGGNTATLLGEEPAWTFTVPGTYEVMLNASDAAGNWDTDTMTVTVLDKLPPTAVPGPNRVTLPGEQVVLDASGSHDSSGITSYSWSFVYNGTQVLLDGPVQSFTFWIPGTYEVTLTVEDAEGKASTAAMTVTVLSPTAETRGGGIEHAGPLAATAIMLVLVAILSLRLRRGKEGEP